MEPEMVLLITVCVLTAVLTFLFFFLIVLYLTTSPYANLHRSEYEYYFTDPSRRDSYIPCPSIDDPASVELSVIIPAYNDETRLPKMLDEAISHLETRHRLSGGKLTYEVIVVDDNSNDRTRETALAFSAKLGTEKLRVLTLKNIRGKGAAVRFGMLSARGRLLLFADADGATRFSDLERLAEELRRTQRRDGTNLVVVCGSRAHLGSKSLAKTDYWRSLLKASFHALVASLCVRDVQDTQCGFKLLTRPAAKLLFTNLHVEDWAFDVDLLYIAQRFDVSISEVPVTCHEVENEKFVPLFGWFQMVKDLLLIRLRYSLGCWKLERIHKVEKVD